MIRVAINGYGRIGRVAHRVILEKFSDQIEIVAINGGESTDTKGWAYLLKYDTSYGILKDHAIYGIEGFLVVDEKQIPFSTERDPGKLPWKALDVDVVIECTGAFTTAEKIQPHLTAGAKKVILSAPAKDHTIKTYVLGVNTADGDIISNASCTTNCVAPVAQIMVAKFGVNKAMMTTMHAYTSDQMLQDGGHKDYRRARAAGANIIPTSSGASIAATEAVPELAGLFTGVAVRVPVVVGSLSDFTFHLKKQVTIEEVNNAFKEAAVSDQYKHILEVSSDPLVSSDIVGNPHSAIVDLSLTQVVGGDMVKVFAWYDNEWGYANRLVEEVVLVEKNNMWFVYALIGALAAGVAAIFNKIGLKTIDSNLAASLRAVVIALSVVLFTFSTGKFAGLNKVGVSEWSWIVLSGLAGAVSWIFYFAALKIGGASAVSAVDRTSIVFVVILATLFLGEKFTMVKFFGAVLIGLGAFLIVK